MSRTLPAVAFAALLAAALVGLVAAWEPEVTTKRVENMPENMPLDRYVSSSRGARPEVLGARSLPAKPTPTVAASPTPAGLGSFTITRYTDNDGEGMDGRGITRSGQRTRLGVAAADWRVLPMGTRVIVEGVGEFTVLDTGGKIVGRRLDLWTQDRQEALRFGVQERGVRLVQ